MMDSLCIRRFLKNIKVADKKTAQNDIDVRAAINEVEETLRDKGRILVRESGTELFSE